MFARSLSCFVVLLCGKADPLFAANEVSLYRTQTQLQAGDAYFSYSDLHRCMCCTVLQRGGLRLSRLCLTEVHKRATGVVC